MSRVLNLPQGEQGPIPQAIQRRYFDKLVHREGVGDDGSCFFHSLACLLNFSNYSSQTTNNRVRLGHNLRKLLRAKITPVTWFDFWKRSGIHADVVPDVRTIRNRMKKVTEWADVYMISWIMDHLNLSLYFFDTTNNRVYCGIRRADKSRLSGGSETGTGFILWLNHAHFEPIGMPSDGRLRFLFPQDHPTVLQVDKSYKDEGCADVTLKHII